MAEPVIKIIETCQISPPEGSVPLTNLPLTFFDLVWFSCFPKRLLVFELPQPTDHFTLTVVPRLKRSLSAALRHFFPLAGRLVSPPEPLKPYIRFSPGGGSVSFTVAESGADFKTIVSNEPRGVAECHPLVPTLPPAYSDGEGGARELPLLAVQVTVFPDCGFTVGATYCHVACDGRAFAHFVKSWSWFCRSYESQELTLVDPPCHDRSTIVDQYGLEPVYLRDWWAAASANKLDTRRGHAAPGDKVRATFVLGRAHIDKLKHSVSAHYRPSTLHVSSFVVTIACTWVNLIKTLINQIKENEMCHLLFPADCRNRSGFEPPIPAAYFGNCLAACFVSMKRNEMIGENGLLATAKAIGEAIKELEKEPLRGAETAGSTVREMAGSGNLVNVTGSANLGWYEIDFGWGKPEKSLVTHIDASGAMISLAECTGEGGGVEIGLALNKDKMSTFTTLFERSLEHL